MEKKNQSEELERLRAQVAQLEAKLANATRDGEDARLRAQFIGEPVDAIKTGRKVKIAKCIGYDTVSYLDDGRPILKPKWDKEGEEVETYMVKIDLPPVGGLDIKVNGMSLQHGEVYELNLYELRSVREIMYRIREHEANIHGSNENAYRNQTRAQFSGKTGGRVH